jgi:uncharacterized protein YaaN involved in tellurite resistance
MSDSTLDLLQKAIDAMQAIIEKTERIENEMAGLSARAKWCEEWIGRHNRMIETLQENVDACNAVHEREEVCHER